MRCICGNLGFVHNQTMDHYGHTREIVFKSQRAPDTEPFSQTGLDFTDL